MPAQCVIPIRMWSGAVPSSSLFGTDICIPLGIRVYDGNGDNEGTTQERTDRCAHACFSQIAPLEYGLWSDRGSAVGYAMKASSGRCYCQHVEFISCQTSNGSYTAYEFDGASCLLMVKVRLKVRLPMHTDIYHAARTTTYCTTSTLRYDMAIDTG